MQAQAASVHKLYHLDHVDDHLEYVDDHLDHVADHPTHHDDHQNHPDNHQDTANVIATTILVITGHQHYDH